ncbi:metacaspase putative (MCA5) [Leptomonas pyrrhocoris]|uniref:Metacaspase putative (MCA5) n=1 Tax=Leptomonas pyrrhocoris TaxID=157538 RepID=A0A0M9GA98_LEPPY|nr:metacaspase putative (MCA5) [Leptomonas pyrrhocoris]KPA86073.1 metacaspase putative (MCA5) [Leptomonas pyrrhocoris]|eukprot:XP_015664512.1 metacaspase putative (MCA5) [Leptomonas pyrrhocoris]
MAELILGLVLGQVASMALPVLANGLLSVKRPPRVNINNERQKVTTCRPVIPYCAPVPYTGGRVRALFIGINYTGTGNALRGCVNDVRSMLGTLQQIQFPISECCILVDDTSFPNFTALPTRENIIKYMLWLTHDLRPGDVLFLHYSGHGGQTKSTHDSQEEYDQTMIPLDHQQNGSILDDDLFLMLVAPLPPGVRMTCVFDCCHSATMLDLPFSYIAPRHSGTREQMMQVRRDNFSNGDVIMFSGCTDEGTSADVHGGGGTANGAATLAFTWSLLHTQGFNYLNILLKTREELRKKGREQVPQLTSSKPIDLYKPFSLFGMLTVNQTMMSQCVPQQYQRRPPNMPPPQGGYPAYMAPPPQGYQQRGGPGDNKNYNNGSNMVQGVPMERVPHATYSSQPQCGGYPQYPPPPNRPGQYYSCPPGPPRGPPGPQYSSLPPSQYSYNPNPPSL